jgi:hypothetical protein
VQQREFTNVFLFFPRQNALGTNIHVCEKEIIPGGASEVTCLGTTFCAIDGLNDSSIFDKTTNGMNWAKCKNIGIVESPGVGVCPA